MLRLVHNRCQHTCSLPLILPVHEQKVRPTPYHQGQNCTGDEHSGMKWLTPTQAVRTGRELWPRGQGSGSQFSSGPGCREKLGKCCPCLVFSFFICILTWPVVVSLCEVTCMSLCSVPINLCADRGSGLGLMQAVFGKGRNWCGLEKAE